MLCFALARPLLSVANTLVQIITVELASVKLRIQRIAIMAAGLGIGSGLSAVVHGVLRGPDSFRWLFAIALMPALLVVPLLHTIPEPATQPGETPLAHLGVIAFDARSRLAIVARFSFSSASSPDPRAASPSSTPKGSSRCVLRACPRSSSRAVSRGSSD